MKKLGSKIKKILGKLTGKENYLKKAVSCKKEWYGNDYGGFYICTELLNKDSIIYSFGIGEDISFDKTLIEKHNCNVFGFDPTPKSINWVNRQSQPQNFHFFDFGISNKTGIVDFYLPKNPNHVSGSSVVQNNINVAEKVSVKMKSIRAIMQELGHKHIDVLKMDIEGAEYDVIENVLKDNISITQILIEFHDRLIQDGRRRTIDVLNKLKLQGYEIFAVSDSSKEVSFINKKVLEPVS